MRNLPRPEPNWLQRLLFYVRPPKASQRLTKDIGDGEYAWTVRHPDRILAEKGKDEMSLDAMKIVPPDYPVDRGETYCDVIKLLLTRAEGKINELEAVIHRMRCHEAHLDEIIARQDKELKKLRSGGQPSQG